jgi:predicted nucleic acid-binding protein
MAFKVFFDTNIVVDFFIADRLGHDDAKKLMAAVENTSVKGFFSECVVNTTAYLVRKSIAINRFREEMIEMLTLVKILPCTNTIAKGAYTIAQNDLEDAVLYQLAFDNKMDYFITSDLKDLKKISHPSLPIINAKKMVELLKSNKS